jgi:hypothetical protein
VERDAGHECEETRRHVTRFQWPSLGPLLFHATKYGPAKFVVVETTHITKGVDTTVVRVGVHGSSDGPMSFNCLHWHDQGGRIRGRG